MEVGGILEVRRQRAEVITRESQVRKQKAEVSSTGFYLCLLTSDF
jgi:hypothetical protein